MNSSIVIILLVHHMTNGQIVQEYAFNNILDCEMMKIKQSQKSYNRADPDKYFREHSCEEGKAIIEKRK